MDCNTFVIRGVEVGFCPFREPGAVLCMGGRCEKCGWHQLVEERRKERIRASLKLA